MPVHDDVHAFAVKWFDKFRETKTVSHEVEEPAFADECFWLGFEMDCGKAFEAAYPNTKAFSDYRTAILQCECEKPYIKLVTPFMERNGYRDSRGWRVKAEETNKNL